MELIKDNTIIHVLSLLQQKFGVDSFKVEDYWDADLFAIGIADVFDKYLLYISSYKQPNGSYYVELESKEKGESNGNVIHEFSNLTMCDLEDVFKMYFY